MTKPTRPSMSKARRARIFAAHFGICGISGKKIGPDDAYEIEHRIPWAISFDDSDANLYPALVEPHKIKTKADVKAIAKCKRIEKKSDPLTRKPSRMQSRGFQKGGPKQKIPARPWDRKGDRT